MANDILIDLGISAILTLLKSIPKSAEQKRKYRNVILKIYNAIGLAYGDDDAFTKAEDMVILDPKLNKKFGSETIASAMGGEVLPVLKQK